MGETPESTASAGLPYPEKRSVPRYTFIASVAFTDDATAARMAGRISEISRKGCYVDILNTLPVGTRIHLIVSRDQGSFSTPGRIIYVQESMGMGVAFVDSPADQLKILDQWLAELAA